MFQCLVSNSAFALGTQFIAILEEKGEGVQWGNTGYSETSEFTFAWTCYMMAIDGVIYGLIGWYIRNIWAGGYNGKSGTLMQVGGTFMQVGIVVHQENLGRRV